MRAAYHLAIAVFSVGAVATSTTAPNATNPADASFPTAHQHVIRDVIRSIAADLSAGARSWQDLSSMSGVLNPPTIGEALPGTVDLHPIPKHETYRYAVVDNRRVIVDAASRKVVYIIQ